MTVRQDLMKYAVAKGAKGWTKQQAAAHIGCSMGSINLAVIQIRRTLAGSPYTLVAERPGDTGPWRFFITQDANDVEAWGRDRRTDLEGRLFSLHAQAQSEMAMAPDKRTGMGKRAAFVEKALRRLLEDLEDIAA